MNHKTDRRVKYTKTALREALVTLMQDRRISQITVKALCDLADVNRSTFYAHYTDPYDLLGQVEAEVLENLRRFLKTQQMGERQPVSEPVLTRILDYVKENPALFKALLSENSHVSIQKDIVSLIQVVDNRYRPDLDQRTIDYLGEFGINGCVSILQKWLGDGMIEPSSSLAELILNVLYYGTSRFQ